MFLNYLGIREKGRDVISADWFKLRISEITGSRGETFRAWGKDDSDSRICRVFIPERFKDIANVRILPILKGLNPIIRSRDVNFKEIRADPKGRAFYMEVDMDTYGEIRKTYKLEWLLVTQVDHKDIPSIIIKTDE